MRIISGTLKGRRVVAPKNLPVRPTTDMAKEALFNILNNNYYFDEISVLELFSGIGSISLEFASRGTTQITSIDSHYGCVNFLNKTAEQFDLPIQIIKSDVYAFLKKQSKKYDVIFADPPYNFSVDQLEKIHTLVFENKLLNEDGMLIIEHNKQTDLSELSSFSKVKNYGGNCFSFFE
jgi:16S rRNA (guanine(966)-N(2))-methyltransferase RsmD